jgi:predicted nucleic acid-binding protein
VLPLVREHRLSACDAAYLELAKREGMHLATLDHDLQEESAPAKSRAKVLYSVALARRA